jgi:hypothetical protein
MFDDEFKRSELYFGALQLLRVSSDWIEETMEDLKSSHMSCIEGLETTRGFITNDCELRDEDIKLLDSAWQKLRNKKGDDYKTLLQRIKRKRKEVESLRDGVSIYLFMPYLHRLKSHGKAC